MATELTEDDRTTSFSAPWLASLRNALIGIGSGWMLPRAKMPTATERSAIRNRINALTSRLNSGASNDRALAVEISRLVAAFPAQGQSAAPAELRMEAYFEALDGIPAWTIGAARVAALRGEAGCDPRFAPTPPQLALIARERLQRIRDELAVLRRIDSAVPDGDEPTEEERRRVEEGFSGFLVELGVKTDAWLRSEAEEGLRARCRELGIPSTAIDELPPAPERTGTFRRMKARAA